MLGGLIGGLGLGAKVAVGMGAMLLVTTGAFAWYFNSSQGTIAVLNQEIGVEKVARVIAEAGLEQVRDQINTQTRELGRLADEMAENRQAQERITDIFAEHDLNRLVEARPGLIETRVNAGTRDVLNKLEEITDPRTYDDVLVEEE